MSSEFPYRNLSHYLEVHGLHEAQGSVLDVAKKEYRKLYLRNYRAKRNKQQVNVLLKSKEVNYLEGKVEEYKMKKISRYIRHLVAQDMEGTHTRPNLLIDIEIGILKCIDGLGKIMKARPETRSALIDTYQQLEELILLLTT